MYGEGIITERLTVRRGQRNVKHAFQILSTCRAIISLQSSLILRLASYSSLLLLLADHPTRCDRDVEAIGTIKIRLWRSFATLRLAVADAKLNTAIKCRDCSLRARAFTWAADLADGPNDVIARWYSCTRTRACSAKTYYTVEYCLFRDALMRIRERKKKGKAKTGTTFACVIMRRFELATIFRDWPRSYIIWQHLAGMLPNSEKGFLLVSVFDN